MKIKPTPKPKPRVVKPKIGSPLPRPSKPRPA